MGDLSVTRSYESHRNLLTSIENRFDTNTISRYSYDNDAGGRRVSVIQTGTAFEPVGAMFNLYRYNSRSELTSAERYFGSNTNDTSSPVGLQDWSYAFDNIGNRIGTMKANASANYTANSLNQYTERTVHGSSDIIGSAEQDVTIEVNGNEADRQGYYWSHRLTVDNLFNPIYTQVVVEAICDPGTNDPFVVSSETGNVFVAASPEEFAYDDDGNLLSDGRFEYQWDCENRLIAATTKGGLPEDMPIVHVAFQYDYMSRRVGKTVYQSPPSFKVETTARSPLRSENAANTNWTQTDARTFLYDSWNVIQEVSIQDSDVSTNHYVWGIDLSGSLQGAGGIGGLLASVSGTNASVFTFDGNGNVSEVIDAQTGAIAAHYEYSPFGETIVATGPLAAENPFRFSTKYFDDETGLAYYGYRCYSPRLGRWPSRDPTGEWGGLNIYAFIDNSPVDSFDIYGLWTKEGVLKILCCTKDKHIVDTLNGVTVFKFDKILRKWKLYKKNADGSKGDFVKNHEYEVDGLSGDDVWVKSSLSDVEAAATLFHEGWHQEQNPSTDILEKEYDAWINEMKFRARHNIPIPPDFVKKDDKGNTVKEPDGNPMIDEDKVKADVKKSYQHRDPSRPFVYEWNGQDVTGKEKVSGWSCKGINGF